jgi:hypothetical protein
MITEHIPFESVHAVEAKETEPVPLWDQLTSPVGEYPVTLALHVTELEESAGTLAGLQKIRVLVAFIVTIRL